MKIKKLLSKNTNKRRTVLTGVTALLLVTLAVAGTVAWVSISQSARNDSLGASDSGGRIHDDFDGENKDVYAENYSDTPLQVRIRLDEYLEIGEGAGLRTGDPGFDDKVVTVFTNGSNGDPSNIEDVTTWQTHIPFSTDPSLCSGTLHIYFDWAMGGQKDYLPTFNKDNDSKSTDVTGIAIDGDTGMTNTAPGKDPITDPDNDGSHNYWTAGETLTDAADYGSGTIVTEEHTVQPTLNATVISMAQWIAMDRPSGAFWVYDTDGWAYWAQLIEPGTSTGLLLDEISLLEGTGEDYYYGINVVGQFASKEDFAVFYDSDNGAPVKPGSDAEYLLRQNGARTIVRGMEITPNPAPDFIIDETDEIDFNIQILGINLQYGTDDAAVVWSIEPGHGGSFDTATGKLTGAVNPGEYDVTATSNDDPTKSVTITVKVVDPKEYIGPTVAIPLYFPVMTSNNAPSPFEAFEASNNSVAWNAFDNNPATYWHNGGPLGVLPAMLSIGNSVVSYEVSSYSITSRAGYGTQSPSVWTFEGSNDNSNWTVLDTHSSVSWTNAQVTKTFTLSAPVRYHYYRINITANAGYSSSAWPTACSIAEFKFYGTANTTLDNPPLLTLKIDDKYQVPAKTVADKDVKNAADGTTITAGTDIPAGTTVLVLTDDTKIGLLEDITTSTGWVRRADS